MRRYVLLFALILAACQTPDAATPLSATTATAAPSMTVTAAATQTVTAQPTTPQTMQPPSAVEAEIVVFAVDFILDAEIRDMANFIQQSGDPTIPGPPKASIIIYSHLAYDPDHPEWGPNIDEKRPIQVWWYEDDKLSETSQKPEAIARYHEQYMKKPASGIFAWGYYAFGIVSASSADQEAQLYIGASCGPVCGHGVIYTIRRQPSGKWRIADQQFIWGS